MAETTSTTPPRRSSEAAARADLLCAFANTLDVDVDADRLEGLPDPPALTAWLLRHRLVAEGAKADVEDHRLGIALRSGLRAAMSRHQEHASGPLEPDLDAVAAYLPVRVVFEGTRPLLAPSMADARGGLCRLLIAIVEAQADGTWERLKLCAANGCRLAFLDASKNRSRQWCSMEVCGNRQKSRSFRARKRSGA